MPPYHRLTSGSPAMGTATSASTSSARGSLHQPPLVVARRRTTVPLACRAAAGANADAAAAPPAPLATPPTPTPSTTTTRRTALVAAMAASSALLIPFVRPAAAIQGLTAGRIPGLSTVPDADGFVTYTRPEGKSGGHGVGWSEIPRFAFNVPQGWDEVPVSIADLGGTEIDVRFSPPDGGVSLSVVIAPVLRFLDLGYNSDVRLPDVGPPEKLIAGFYPELFGKTMEEGDVLAFDVVTKKPRNGRSDTRPLTYYNFELAKKRRVAMTATGNRVFILSLSPKSSVAARKHGPELQRIAESFEVEASEVRPL